MTNCTETVSSSKMYSIRQLKREISIVDLMGSPKKCTKALRCSILTKSELKPSKNPNGGSNFSMTLCDEDPTSTLRAVCFDERMYKTLTPLKTYIISNYKIKKGLGANVIQVHLDAAATIEVSLEQYKIEKVSFNIAQIIRKEASNVRMVNINCKIADIEEVKLVGKPPNQIQKRDVYCADATGVIVLVFWRDMAENIDFAVNDVVSVENVVTSSYNNKINLSATSQTIIRKIEDPVLQNVSGNFSSPVFQDTITSVNTKIVSMKDFKQQAICINCKNSIPINTSDEDAELLQCGVCTATFLIQDTKILNECSFFLKDNQQWFLAKTGVINNIFKWMETKAVFPSKKDISNMLRLHYTMTINITKQTIEHAQITPEPSSEEENPQKKQRIQEDNKVTCEEGDMETKVEEGEDIRNKLKQD